MFGFVRWLFLIAVIVALTAAVVGIKIGGRTSAEAVCRLTQNAGCLHYAERAELLFDAAARRLRGTQNIAAARRDPGGHRSPGVRVAEPNHSPLDRHTNQERHALDHILIERGSH